MRRIILSVCVLGLLASASWANSTGLAGYSGKSGFNCNICHSGGSVPVVAFDGPAAMNPGQTSTFTFTVSATSSLQGRAGVDIAASDGTLSSINGQGTREQSGEIVQTAPKVSSSEGVTTFMVRWKAPAKAHNYILYGAGNSVNFNGTTSGDMAAAVQFFVAVGSVTPLPSVTSTPTRTATKTRSETPTPTPTETATFTVTPTMAEPTPTSTATETQMATPTYTSSATASVTSQPSATATATATASPTPVLVGDANCDGKRSAGDIEEVALVVAASMSDCGGADVDGDGLVTSDDMLRAAVLVFEE